MEIQFSQIKLPLVCVCVCQGCEQFQFKTDGRYLQMVDFIIYTMAVYMYGTHADTLVGNGHHRCGQTATRQKFQVYISSHTSMYINKPYCSTGHFIVERIAVAASINRDTCHIGS